MFFQFLICIFSWLTFASAAPPQTKLGCQSTCGDVSIPYPFGIGVGCYQNSELALECNKSFTPPRLLLGNIPVRNISLLSGTMTIAFLVSFNCYNKDGTSSGKFSQKMTLASLFTFSDTRNKLTAIGCDTYAVMSDGSGDIFQSGCISFCQNSDNVVEGSCSSIGCCQTAIPMGLKTLNVSLSSFYNHSNSWAYNPCSYAFLADSEQFKFSRSDLKNFTGIGPEIDNQISFLAVLDWVVGNETCEKAQTNLTSYACGDNSYCDDYHNTNGYRCTCPYGYEGNPYLANGCQGLCLRQGGLCKAKKVTTACIRPWWRWGWGILLLLFVAIAFWFYGKLKKRRALQRRQELFKRNGGLLLQQQISSGESNVEKTKIFVTEELEKATDNFNENRVLGRGGSGTVYKGMLPDGRIVAIKKSKLVDETQIGQFINELVILSEINHKNIVKVIGCCLETEVPLLVYEYVSRGTLSEHLHGKNFISSISWEDRLGICKEIAGALTYLHSSLSTPIFHRDVKSSNILLDENFKAKVSDFGISRSVPYEQTHLSTLVQGTFGYLDPEYFHSGQFTEKSDVYGFGVVLVELLTGQKPISNTRSEEEANLAMHFISSVKEDRVLQILETRIANEARKEEIQIVASLAKKCLKIVGKKRPTMKEVLIQLENLRVFQHQESLRLLTEE
ncbi:hypothetical protein GIB67_033720 [Kingdonia uniflora]|uniref:Protein kinase domain-containing protein n=1 Tax=Kingdonia uniflora TaxID=39325 RepID=A0A7J7P4T7_9MAGN|nr:hypothetical protein GIB67_033720 [Kingdonia uniflora]